MFKSINKVIKALILSNFFLESGWGLLAPIFAIFLLENIAAGNVAEGARIAGYSALIFWTVKSTLQIPIAYYVDKVKGEKDDFWFMVFGTLLGSTIPFAYLLASLPWHVYLLQCLWALAMAMLVPSRQAVFSRYIDKDREAFAWGLDSTFMGFGIGICGALGGVIVSLFGFKAVFFLAGVGTLLSSLSLLLANKYVHPGEGVFPDFFPSLPIKEKKIGRKRFFKGRRGPF